MNTSIYKDAFQSGKTAHSVEHLQYKHEDLSLISEPHKKKKPGMMPHVYNLSTEEAGTDRSRGY